MAATSKSPKNKATNWLRLGLFWAIVIVGILTVVALVSPHQQLKEVPLSDVVKRANDGKIDRLDIQGNTIKVTPKGKDAPTETAVKDGASIYEQGLKPESNVTVNQIPP
ncbi:MAG: ATP-dependent metallopeptidase FtsH/Yme1/Tma family protein, partial [Candidatus Saccharimonadales bacterium]